jgi:hypothetical protein
MEKSKIYARGQQKNQTRPETYSVAQVYKSKVIPKRNITPASPKIS